MTNDIEKDLIECLGLISADWKMQSNNRDKSTNFIYKAKTLAECLDLIKRNNANKDYALHRWYNYITSLKCEDLFCEYGAVHDTNIYNHNIDIYINNIPFDVKLTVYPAKLSNRPYNLNTRTGKNELIRWYYTNQSQESRKQLLNRLYVVCDGKDSYECLKLKSDFPLLRKKIEHFMSYCLKNGINSLDIVDNGKQYTVYSDIIYISYLE